MKTKSHRLSKIGLSIVGMAAPLLLLSGCTSHPSCSATALKNSNRLFFNPHTKLSPTPCSHPRTPPSTSPPQLTQALVAGPHQGDLSHRQIYFADKRFDIPSYYLPILKAHANYLKHHPSTQLLIEGNTDSHGRHCNNLALGQKRANAVAAQLRRYGVTNTYQIQTMSYGEARPVDLGVKPEDYAKNRRVDLIYVSHY